MRRSPTIRAARSSESNCIAVLATQVWLHTYATDGISNEIAQFALGSLTPQRFQSIIANSMAKVFVAEVRGNIVGLAVLQFGSPCPAGSTATVELETLYVQEHFIGQGIGHALLRTALVAASDMSKPSLWLTVNAHNAKAITFYFRHGFAKIGTSYFVLGESKHENHVLVSPDAG